MVDRGREGEKEVREGWKEGGREGEKEGRSGEKERGRGGVEKGREGGRDKEELREETHLTPPSSRLLQ